MPARKLCAFFVDRDYKLFFYNQQPPTKLITSAYRLSCSTLESRFASLADFARQRYQQAIAWASWERRRASNEFRLPQSLCWISHTRNNLWIANRACKLDRRNLLPCVVCVISTTIQCSFTNKLEHATHSNLPAFVYDIYTSTQTVMWIQQSGEYQSCRLSGHCELFNDPLASVKTVYSINKTSALWTYESTNNNN